MIELARLCSEASFDVAQAFAVGKLRESHAEILIEARKRFDFVFAPRNALHSDETLSVADAP